MTHSKLIITPFGYIEDIQNNHINQDVENCVVHGLPLAIRYNFQNEYAKRFLHSRVLCSSTNPRSENTER